MQLEKKYGVHQNNVETDIFFALATFLTLQILEVYICNGELCTQL